MKKAIFALSAGLMIMGVGTGLAVNKSNTGCGLGYVLMKNQEGILFEALAVTTNGTSANQTFGITSGTSECKQPASFVKNEKLEKFVYHNMDELAVDIAKGEGKYLETLADLMNVPVEERGEFYSKLKNNFDKIFHSEDVTPNEVINTIVSL